MKRNSRAFVVRARFSSLALRANESDFLPGPSGREGLTIWLAISVRKPHNATRGDVDSLIKADRTMEKAAEKSKPRGWLSLLTHRWHTSSRVVLVLSLLFLVFCNIPGQRVQRVRLDDHFPIGMRWHLEHGWPFTWLASREEREYDQDGVYVQIATAKYFDLWRDGTELHARWIAVNLAVAVAASLIVGAAFEFWRRARKRLWQLHLSDIAAVTIVVALATFWCVQRMDLRAREIAVIHGLSGRETGLAMVEYQEGGISWLRNLLGDRHFIGLDLPLGVSVGESTDWSRVSQLSSVRSLYFEGRPSTDDLAHLTNLPNLECVSIVSSMGSATYQKGGPEFPVLPKVRVTTIFGVVLDSRIRGIERLTSLEFLQIFGMSEDESVLDDIARTPTIRQLSFESLPESADLSFLSRMPNLTELNLYNSSLTQAKLQQIGRCPQLTKLTLDNCDLDAGDFGPLASLKSLRELSLTRMPVNRRVAFIAELSELEVLDLQDTDVSGSELQCLAGLRHLRDLDLHNLAFHDDYPPALRKLTQLKRLRISARSEKIAVVQNALPNCVVGLDPPPYRPRKISW